MQIGSYIARYVVLKLLGAGGMVSVYLVEQIDLKTRHAIQVLSSHFSKHEQIVQRFRNETRTPATARGRTSSQCVTSASPTPKLTKPANGVQFDKNGLPVVR